VIGHTDTVGSGEDNLELSGKPRQSCPGLPGQRQGVDPDQLRVGWHGETNLAVPTANPEEKNENRRVVLTVTFSDPAGAGTAKAAAGRQRLEKPDVGDDTK
jgi:flagellar motor protein MotB